MRRFGFRIDYAIIFLIVISLGACIDNANYKKDDMARLSTTVRTVLSVIKGKYYKKKLPDSLSEKKILQIVLQENTKNFSELKVFNKHYDIKIVSNGKELGAIVWDNRNNRKLIQDLQCTLFVDDPAWKREDFGQAFTLKWSACP